MGSRVAIIFLWCIRHRLRRAAAFSEFNVWAAWFPVQALRRVLLGSGQMGRGVSSGFVVGPFRSLGCV